MQDRDLDFQHGIKNAVRAFVAAGAISFRSLLSGPTPARVTSLTVTPADAQGVGQVTVGETATLSWTVDSFGATGTTVTIEGRWSGQVQWAKAGLPTHGTLAVQPTHDPTTYTVYGHTPNLDDDRDNKSVQIRVAPMRVPPTISFTASPNDGYINVGQSATLSWQVSHCEGSCNVSLEGKDSGDNVGYWHVVLHIPHAGIAGSIQVTPVQTLTEYTLTATGDSGSTSAQKVVQLYGTPIPPPGKYWFKMENPQSFANPCFTVLWSGNDQASAKHDVELKNPGYTATHIDESQAATACNS